MEEPYEIGSSVDKSYVFARAFQQPYTYELALELLGKLIPLGIQLGVRGCLLDLRGTVSKSNPFDKYKFAFEESRLAKMPRHWRYALLKDPEDESEEFIETVMVNAGYMFRIFKNEHDAIHWLKGLQNT